MNIKHNLSTTAEYIAWTHIKERCLNANHPQYQSYGGRGITLHGSWIESFEAFLSYVGVRPSEDHSIDRIDNDAGYFPENVRWATRSEQQQNKRPMLTRSPHGRPGRYKAGCRCDVCVQSNRKRNRDYYHEHR